MSRVPKLTVDSVLTHQRMNAIRDRLEELLSMLVADHGYDGSVFSTAETRLGKHAWRTAAGSSISFVGTYVVSGASVLAGHDDSVGPVIIDVTGATLVRMRGPSVLAAAVSYSYGGTSPGSPAAVIIERTDGADAVEWPWSVRVTPPDFTSAPRPISVGPFTFILQVWGY
jgi:hypothetical protein